MRVRKRLGWVMAGIVTAGLLPAALAMGADTADPSLEERVRALEKKVNQEEKPAGSVGQRLDAIEKEVKDQEKSITEKLGFSFHGLVAVDYLYDINSPGAKAPVALPGGSTGPAPFLRSFTNEKNSVILNLANLHVERQSDTAPGFVADINFGKTADTVNNATHFSGNQSSLGNGTDFFDATQFYLTYTIPVGSGIKMKAGRFVTLAGEEVIKAYNNVNFNVSNSILFGYAIPFTHTGLLTSYAFSDLLGVDLGVVNGWDDVADNNDGKTLLMGINIAPDPMFTAYLTTLYGAEQPGNGQSKRFLETVVFTIKPTDQLTFIVDYDYGNESNIALAPNAGTPTDPPGSEGIVTHVPGNVMWQGVAGYIVYALNDDWQLALRSEVFDDPDGVRTLVQQTGYGPGATYWEMTPTVTYKITDGLLWRNEYRHDESDKKVFPQGNLYNRGQDTLATELVYTF